MSVYGINKVSHLLQVDVAFRNRMAQDPRDAIADIPLTDEERSALLGGDVARLYELGAHTFLLSRIPRFLPGLLERDLYIERMRALLAPEEAAAIHLASTRTGDTR